MMWKMQFRDKDETLAKFYLSETNYDVQLALLNYVNDKNGGSNMGNIEMRTLTTHSIMTEECEKLKKN